MVELQFPPDPVGVGVGLGTGVGVGIAAQLQVLLSLSVITHDGVLPQITLIVPSDKVHPETTVPPLCAELQKAPHPAPHELIVKLGTGVGVGAGVGVGVVPPAQWPEESQVCPPVQNPTAPVVKPLH